jgi:competence transcription factor ComK
MAPYQVYAWLTVPQSLARRVRASFWWFAVQRSCEFAQRAQEGRSRAARRITSSPPAFLGPPTNTGWAVYVEFPNAAPANFEWSVVIHVACVTAA